MRYALIVESKVHQLIEEIDPTFPGIPLSERYSPDFLKDCVECGDAAVRLGWTYDGTTFSAPTPPPEPTPGPDTPLPVVPTVGEKITALEEENKTLKAQLNASIQSNQTLEDCIVEMAGIVYA